MILLTHPVCCVQNMAMEFFSDTAWYSKVQSTPGGTVASRFLMGAHMHTVLMAFGIPVPIAFEVSEAHSLAPCTLYSAHGVRNPSAHRL